MSALIVCLWPGRLLTPGLNCKPCHFKATSKNRRICGCVDTQSLRICVSYPRIQLFQGYCFEVAGYSVVTPTLVVSGEPQGPLLISCIFFFWFIKTTGSAPPDTDFSQTPWNSFFAPYQYIYSYKLAYLFGTYTPATGSPNERLSSEVIFLLRKESVLRCFGAHSCCQQTYLYRQNPVKSLAYRIDLLIFNVFSQCLSSGSLSNNDVDAYENVT